MRKELIFYLSQLSDRSYQERHWVKLEEPASEMDFAIHFLFDDTFLYDDPESCIGKFLEDENEMRAVSDVVKILDRIFQVFGTDGCDQYYISKPEWEEVLSASGTAVELLKANP